MNFNPGLFAVVLLLLCAPALALVASDRLTLPNFAEITVYRQTEWIHCRTYTVVFEVKALRDLYVERAGIVFKFLDERTLAVTESEKTVWIQEALAKSESLQFSASSVYCPREPRDPLILMTLTLYTNVSSPSLSYFIGRAIPKTYDELMEEAERLRGEVDRLKKEAERLREEVEGLEERLMNRERELAEKEGMLRELRGAFEELKAKYQELVREYGELQRKYGELNRSYVRLLEEKRGLEESYRDLSAKYNELKLNQTATLVELNNLRARFAELAEELDRVRKAKEELEDSLARLRGEHESLQNVFEDLRRDYENLHYRYELTVGDLKTATTLAIVAFVGFAGSSLAYLWPKMKGRIRRSASDERTETSGRGLTKWPLTEE